MSKDDSGIQTNKVDRVIEKYELDDLGLKIENRWLGVDGEQYSTRELAEYLNKRVLDAAVTRSDAISLTGNIDELYHVLTDDTDADTTLVRSRLQQNGVEVDTVTSDFVSHQTIYRYLKKQREVERPERTLDERREDAINTVQRLRGRTSAVTKETINNLKRGGILDVSEFSVLNDVQILCEHCGRSYDVAAFIERGGCDCDRSHE